MLPSLSRRIFFGGLRRGLLRPEQRAGRHPHRRAEGQRARFPCATGVIDLKVFLGPLVRCDPLRS